MKILKALLVVTLLTSIFFVTKNAISKAEEPATGLVTPAPVIEAEIVTVAEEPLEVAPEVMEPVFVPIQFEKLKDLKALGGVKVKVAKSLNPKGKGYKVDGDTYFLNKDGSYYVIRDGEVIFIK